MAFDDDQLLEIERLILEKGLSPREIARRVPCDADELIDYLLQMAREQGDLPLAVIYIQYIQRLRGMYDDIVMTLRDDINDNARAGLLKIQLELADRIIQNELTLRALIKQLPLDPDSTSGKVFELIGLMLGAEAQQFLEEQTVDGGAD